MTARGWSPAGAVALCGTQLERFGNPQNGVTIIRVEQMGRSAPQFPRGNDHFPRLILRFRGRLRVDIIAIVVRHRDRSLSKLVVARNLTIE
jgi:hypothetical protein